MRRDPRSIPDALLLDLRIEARLWTIRLTVPYDASWGKSLIIQRDMYGYAGDACGDQTCAIGNSIAAPKCAGVGSL